MTKVTVVTAKASLNSGQIGTYVESYLNQLRESGYAKRTLCGKRRIIACFAQWAELQQVIVEDLNESHIAAFVDRSAKHSQSRRKYECTALRPFLGYIVDHTRVTTTPSQVDVSASSQIETQYADYLRTERGLSERSVHIYLTYVHDFFIQLDTQIDRISTPELDAQRIQDFLLDRTRDRSAEYCRLLATAMRSLLRFLYHRGKTTIDLSRSVPTVQRHREATVHPYLSPDELERVLSATNQSSASGCRDYAILLLLARLGLRAGEIVTLELEDIRWRTGELVVRGKGRMLDRLPLLAEVGEALALYVREHRGRSSSRRVFLRMFAPHVGLSGPISVGHIVRRALARASVRPSSRGAAHLFRHSLATRMIRDGASITEIAEVLRHRAQSTTQIYAKVAFESLRGVARRWPRTGGAS